MSVLAMILTAAMAVPGDGPKKASMEMVQVLDLIGKWEGNLCFASFILNVKVINGRMIESGIPFKLGDLPLVVGENRVKWKIYGESYLGIYKQEGDQVTICLRLVDFGWPTSFKVDDVQRLFILHRVKFRK